MGEDEIYVVTGAVLEEINKDGNGLLDMPDWVLDEVKEDKAIKAITALLADLNVMGPGFMLKGDDFRKSIFYDNEDLTEKQANTIEKLLLGHGILVNLADIVADEHPDWSKEEISNAVIDIYNGGRDIRE